MDRKEIQKRYDEQLAKVYELVGDNNKLKESIDNLSSLRAQLAVEPMAFYLEEKAVIKKIDLGTCEIGLSEKCAYFRTKGGYRIFVKLGLGLYSLIQTFIEAHETKDNMSEEEVQNLIINTSALKAAMQAPLVAATDMTLLCNLAAEILEYTNEQVEKSLGLEAPEEEHQRNENFKDAVSAMENLTEGVQPHAEENNQGESEG